MRGRSDPIRNATRVLHPSRNITQARRAAPRLCRRLICSASLACAGSAAVLSASCTVAVPGDRELSISDISGGGSVATAVLTRAIRHSRAAALADGTRPVPPRIRGLLAPYFSPRLLQDVRWTTVSGRWGLDSIASITRPDFEAITLGDEIVFADRPTSRRMELWIHELLHVRQVRSAGLERFTRRYVVRWPQIEMETKVEANLLAGRILARAREGTAPRGRGSHPRQGLRKPAAQAQS